MKVIKKEDVKIYFDKEELIKFRVFLLKKGMNQNDFAKKCSMTTSYLTLIITGKRTVTNNVIKKFKKGGYVINGYDE